MISARFQGKPFNITVSQVYALTSNADVAIRRGEGAQRKRCRDLGVPSRVPGMSGPSRRALLPPPPSAAWFGRLHRPPALDPHQDALWLAPGWHLPPPGPRPGLPDPLRWWPGTATPRCPSTPGRRAIAQPEGRFSGPGRSASFFRSWARRLYELWGCQVSWADLLTGRLLGNLVSHPHPLAWH